MRLSIGGPNWKRLEWGMRLELGIQATPSGHPFLCFAQSHLLTPLCQSPSHSAYGNPTLAEGLLKHCFTHSSLLEVAFLSSGHLPIAIIHPPQTGLFSLILYCGFMLRDLIPPHMLQIPGGQTRCLRYSCVPQRHTVSAK